MRIEPEFGAASVVMVGHFNPSIFSPAWFQKVGLASEKEADEAKISMIHPEFAMFKLGTKEIQARLDRFSAQTSEAPWISLADFVASTFGEFLPHTPISILGINRFVHFRVGSEIVRNRIGRILAPTKPWGEWGAEIEKSTTDLRSGFTVLSMQQQWAEGEFRGRYEARVEPSLLISGNSGIFVHVNHHCELNDPKPSQEADKIIAFLQKSFDDSIRHSEWIIDQLMSLKEAVDK